MYFTIYIYIWKQSYSLSVEELNRHSPGYDCWTSCQEWTCYPTAASHVRPVISVLPISWDPDLYTPFLRWHDMYYFMPVVSHGLPLTCTVPRQANLRRKQSRKLSLMLNNQLFSMDRNDASPFPFTTAARNFKWWSCLDLSPCLQWQKGSLVWNQILPFFCFAFPNPCDTKHLISTMQQGSHASARLWKLFVQ